MVARPHRGGQTELRSAQHGVLASIAEDTGCGGVMCSPETDPLIPLYGDATRPPHDDRYLDISDGLRGEVLRWMEQIQAPKKLRRLVRDVDKLETEDKASSSATRCPSACGWCELPRSNRVP